MTPGLPVVEPTGSSDHISHITFVLEGFRSRPFTRGQIHAIGLHRDGRCRTGASVGRLNGNDMMRADRKSTTASQCHGVHRQHVPAFGDESVRERGPKGKPPAAGSVRPGLHTPALGGAPVVWWDPAVLTLEVEELARFSARTTIIRRAGPYRGENPRLGEDDRGELDIQARN